jgi:hypothetical protein
MVFRRLDFGTLIFVYKSKAALCSIAKAACFIYPL